MISLLNAEIGLSKSEAKVLVDDLFEILISSLESGKTIRLQHFGTFKLLDKRERIGRNPQTGCVHMVSARRVVSFKPSKKLCDRVQFHQKRSQAEQEMDSELNDFEQKLLSELRVNYESHA